MPQGRHWPGLDWRVRRLPPSASRKPLPSDARMCCIGTMAPVTLTIQSVSFTTPPAGVDRVILPGHCRGDLTAILEKARGLPVELGPEDLRDLPRHTARLMHRARDMAPTTSRFWPRSITCRDCRAMFSLARPSSSSETEPR